MIESIAFYLEMTLPRSEGRARRQLGKLRRQVRQIHWSLSDAIHYWGAAPVRLELSDLSEIVAKDAPEWEPVEQPVFRFELEPWLPLARLDVEQIQHLLRDLLRHVHRISRPKDEITVSTYANGARVFLEIRSSTPGVEQEDFQALFQSQSLDASFPAGSELALASARRIAEAHGATVEFHPVPPGFRLTVGFRSEADAVPETR